jgi:hypothetical protein
MSEQILCSVCNGQLFQQEVVFCEEQAKKYERELIYTHPACFSTAMRQRLSQNDVVLTREEFDRLNAANKLLTGIVLGDRHLNQKMGEVEGELFIKGLPFETYSMMLAKMESVVSVWSMAALKFRRNVGIVSDEEREQIEQARKARHEKKTKELLNAANSTRAEGNVLTPSTAAKKARKILSSEEKAIAAFVEIGYSIAEAKEAVEARRKKATNA